MKQLEDRIEVTSCGEVFPKMGTNTRIPYEHQKHAMESLDTLLWT